MHPWKVGLTCVGEALWVVFSICTFCACHTTRDNLIIIKIGTIKSIKWCITNVWKSIIFLQPVNGGSTWQKNTKKMISSKFYTTFKIPELFMNMKTSQWARVWDLSTFWIASQKTAFLAEIINMDKLHNISVLGWKIIFLRVGYRSQKEWIKLPIAVSLLQTPLCCSQNLEIRRLDSLCTEPIP